MTGIGIRAEETRQQELEKTEQRNPAAGLESEDHVKGNSNQIVKLAMAEELIKMGISRSSAHRILNIETIPAKMPEILKANETNEK